jgi:glycosyltransferase involved in cell wall biosynthesis
MKYRWVLVRGVGGFVHGRAAPAWRRSESTEVFNGLLGFGAMASVDYSILIPCYCSSQWLPELVERLIAVMTKIDGSFEILLINDASPDNTWQTIEELATRYPLVRGLDMQFNVGQFRATICGFENVRGRLIITMDDDLQHPPEEVAVLVAAMAQSPEMDCVMGAFRAKQHSPARNLGTWLLGRVYEIVYEKPRGLRTSAFRIMRRPLVDAVVEHGTVMPNIGPLILRSTHRIRNVEVEHRPRPKGKSGYSFFRLAKIFFGQIISGSTLPLKFLSAIGLSSSLLSVVIGGFYFLRHVLGQITVPGFASQILLTSFFGGLILFSIGILGEYVARIINEVSRPPRYIVRNDTEAE